MSIPLPRLDDRVWQDLRDEGVALIPRYAPTWTDHNVTDPGVTLIELLAYQTELELFRLDQITDTHRKAFLRLLGNDHLPSGPRQARTLLAFDPNSAELLSELESGRRRGQQFVSSVIRTGEYFVPRQAPTRPNDRHRVARISGVQTIINRPPIRQAGEPDEPLLHGDQSVPNAIPEFGFRATHDLFLTRIGIAAVQSFDGRRFRAISDLLVRTRPAAAWGEDPQTAEGSPTSIQPALYIGLNLRHFTPQAPQSENCPPEWALTLWCVPADVELADLGEPRKETSSDDAIGSIDTCPGTSAGKCTHQTAVDEERQPIPHHGLTVQWEYFLNGEWVMIPQEKLFRDDTRGLTRPGRIVIPCSIFSSQNNTVLGAVPAAHFYVRCRLAAGHPDVAPRICGLFADAVLVEQQDSAHTPFRLQRESNSPASSGPPVSIVPPATLLDLQYQEDDEVKLSIQDAMLALSSEGWDSITTDWKQWPLWNRDGFDANQPCQNPSVETTLPCRPTAPEPRMQAVILGVGTGQPNQRFPLPCPPANTLFRPDSPNEEDTGPPIRVMTDTLQVWTLEPPDSWRHHAISASTRMHTKHLESPSAACSAKWKMNQWDQIPDLILGSRKSNSFVYDSNVDRRLTPVATPSRSRYSPPGEIQFGDGEKGRVPPPGALIFASYDWTVAEAANFAAGHLWARSTERDPADDKRVIEFPTIRFVNPLPVAGGREAEGLAQALERLATEFDLPAKLIDLAAQDQVNTLDGLDLSGIIPLQMDVAQLAARQMAVNQLDFEFLARNVPDTKVARARAWVEFDPRFPGHVAPGAVTVVIVPSIPLNRPVPTEGLRQRVQQYLDERRPIACRVFVIGPEYTPIQVRATLHTAVNKQTDVRSTAEQAIRDFLHPLRGGIEGRGWPFGRSVHIGELMRILAGISGVEYVDGLQMAGTDGKWSETAIAVPDRSLVELLDFQLEVRRDA